MKQTVAADSALTPAKSKTSAQRKKSDRPFSPPSADHDSLVVSKAAIDEYKDKIRELMYNNKELQEQQRVQEQDSLEIIKSIQTESDIKDRKGIITKSAAMINSYRS